MKYKAIFAGFFLWLFVATALADLPGGYNMYSANFSVRDKDNSPYPNRNVKLTIVTTTDVGDEFWTVKYGVTNSQGTVYLEALLAPDISVSLQWMEATIDDPYYAEIEMSNYWTNSQNYLNPYFRISYDGDRNGIGDELEMPLAEKFNPTMVTANSTNSIAPEPVEIVTGTMYRNEWGVSLPYANTQGWNYSNLKPSPHVLYHFEWAGLNGNDPSSWKQAYAWERTHHIYAHTYYAHMFKTVPWYVIQYWFFYPYNDGNNNHEGDWEHINVFISSQDPSDAVLVMVEYYFHHKYTLRTPDQITLDAGTHPYVYIGGDPGAGENTGGSYPEPGEWPNTWWSINEHVEGAGPIIHYNSFYNLSPDRGIIILKDADEYDYDQNPEMSWLKANIAWGHPEVTSPGDWLPWFQVGNLAPGGPAFNPGWNKTGSCGDKYEWYLPWGPG